MISLIIKPALLIKKEPIKKSIYQNNSLEVSVFSNAKPNQQGHINRRKPIGLLSVPFVILYPFMKRITFFPQ